MEKYSVAIATYNGQKYISDQLESIINQTIGPDEIIVSDDGSSDDTIKIVEDLLKKSNVSYKIMINNDSHGVVGNFTNAVLNCKNSIVFTSDQDDVWINDKAEIILREFQSYPEIQLVFSDGYLVDSNLSSLGSTLWEAVGLSTFKIREQNWFKYLLKGCIVTGATMAFKKQLFYESLPIPPEWLHDGWLAWMGIAKNGIIACPEKLIKYRQHASNVVGMNARGSYLERIKKWRDNIKILTKFRNNRFLRYKSVVLHGSLCFSEKEVVQLKECMDFWTDLNAMQNRNAIFQLYTITKLYLSGGYEKYYSGLRGFLRDIIWVFVHKKLKNIE